MVCINNEMHEFKLGMLTSGKNNSKKYGTHGPLWQKMGSNSKAEVRPTNLFSCISVELVIVCNLS